MTNYDLQLIGMFLLGMSANAILFLIIHVFVSVYRHSDNRKRKNDLTSKVKYGFTAVSSYFDLGPIVKDL